MTTGDPYCELHGQIPCKCLPLVRAKPDAFQEWRSTWRPFINSDDILLDAWRAGRTVGLLEAIEHLRGELGAGLLDELLAMADASQDEV